MRLSPPPKVVSPNGRIPTTGQPVTGRKRGAGYWATLFTFVALIAVAIAVFVFLPGWVADRSAAAEQEAGTAPAATGATQRSAAPAEGSSPPAPVVDNGGPALASAAATDDEPTMRSRIKKPEATPADSRKRGDGAGSTPVSTPTHSSSAKPASKVTAESAASEQTRADFGRAMSIGLAALERGDLAEAREAFARANQISPAAPEAADGLARVEAAEQLTAIAAHRTRAEALEAQEDWEAAVAEYDAVLKLDPAIRFANEGRSRAAGRLSLSTELDRHLARPDRLATEEVLEEARDLLERARAIEAAGPKLEQRIERLDREVTIASTPVRVALVSDGLTDVLVYRVGRLGKFQRRELDLRPGRYTVVGTREGYRDVRYQLEVSPDGAEPLTVRCEEEV